MEKRYFETVQLLLDVAPLIFRGGDFAMKGGTAINLFHRDMPRLSVDIDVVYVHGNRPREEALSAISQELDRAATELERRGLAVRRQASTGTGDIKLFVRRGVSEVKVEVNPVGRGTLLPVLPAELCASAADEFKRTLRLPILAPAELYGSKLVAAMDRQHPRDWFDCLLLRQNEGLTADIRQTFVAYVAAHKRPINEILTPNPQPLEATHRNDFVGMTRDEVGLEALEETRIWLFEELPKSLTRTERDFLIGLKAGEPDWSLLPFSSLQHMPAVKWTLENRLRSSGISNAISPSSRSSAGRKGGGFPWRTGFSVAPRHGSRWSTRPGLATPSTPASLMPGSTAPMENGAFTPQSRPAAGLCRRRGVSRV